MILRVSPHLNSLNPYRFKKHFKAGRGEHGQGSNCFGKSGEDVVLEVPAGTVVFDSSGNQLCDLTQPGLAFTIARGGAGGRGNARFATPTNQAPRYAQPGQPGEGKELRLELKMIADAGLVGLPNAGKSTLLSRVSHARPKIADYPFTTLDPQVGLVDLGGFDTCVLADLPGLIEGASQGKGLGLQFLRHIERTRVLLFLLDITNEDPAADYKMLKKELQAFHPELLRRPRLVVLNKIDAAPDKKLSPKKFGSRIKLHYISAVSGQGLPALLYALKELLKKS